MKLLRIAEGLSQGEMAQLLKVSQAHLSQVEGGHKVPSLDLLQRIAQQLRVPVAMLMVGADEGSGEDSPLVRKLRQLVIETISARVASGDLQDDGE